MSHCTLVKFVVFIFIVIGFNIPAWCVPIYVYSDNFDLPIPQQPDDSKGWMDDAVINIPDHHFINDLDIEVNITHTSVWDLQLFLISPAGTTVCLNMYSLNDKFFVGSNYTKTIFDDEALTFIKDGQVPFTGRFRPLENLTVFDSQDTFGLWRLRIYDAYYNDIGKLDSYTLFITVPEPATILFLAIGAAFVILCRSLKV